MFYVCCVRFMCSFLCFSFYVFVLCYDMLKKKRMHLLAASGGLNLFGIRWAMYAADVGNELFFVQRPLLICQRVRGGAFGYNAYNRQDEQNKPEKNAVICAFIEYA